MSRNWICETLTERAAKAPQGVFLFDGDNQLYYAMKLAKEPYRGVDKKADELAAGVDMSTGSLGQGLSAAVGMALANKLDKNKNRVYVLVGDGESEEGIVWEAMMCAGHKKLDNLCVFFDENGLQIDGNVQDVGGPLPLDLKAKAFGFNVIKIDGNNFDEIRKALRQARLTKGRPTCIIAKTVKGKGVSFMENNYAWHGAAPNKEQYEQAISDIKEEE